MIAGEPSGDLHGASLIKALKEREPQIQIRGIGGRRMMAAGAHILANLADRAVMGFMDVIKNIFKIQSVLDLAVSDISQNRPDAIILIDYPDFNLKMACRTFEMGIPVIYYVSPQIWAWRRNRIQSIKKYIRKMIVIFRFEEDIYRQEGVPVEWVGHPFWDAIEGQPSAISNQQSDEKKVWKVGLMPGSREGTIRNNIHCILDMITILSNEKHEIKFILVRNSVISNEFIINILGRSKSKIDIILDTDFEKRRDFDFCVTTSGSSTVENAILDTPMMIVYKTNLPTYWLARRLIKLPFIGMVNLLLSHKSEAGWRGDPVAPEFIQHEARGDLLAATAKIWMTNPKLLSDIRGKLKKVREVLGPPGASARAAQAILEM